MPRLAVTTTPDASLRDEIAALVETVTAATGHRPLGEHKAAELRAGDGDWAGVLAFDGPGDRLVGYVHVRRHAAGQEPRMVAELVVHPDHAGGDLPRRLVERTRRLLAGEGGGTLWLWLHRVDDPEATLPAAMGFAVQRTLAFMTRPLDTAPAVALPDGIDLRAYRPGIDDAALLRVNNAAFAAHPENGDWDAAELAARRGLDWFDPRDLLMAWRGDELLGFHWTKWHGVGAAEAPADVPVGEVYVLAVHPDAAGTGLGRALLRAGLGHLHERGARLAVLYVDRSSAAPLGLYRAEGFATAWHEVCYEDRVVADEPATP